MATVLLSPSPKQAFDKLDGTPAAGYRLYTYAAGTVNPQATYSNRAGTTANANPIVLNSRGEAVIYLTPGLVYDYVLKSGADVEEWTQAGVSAIGGDSGGTSFTQTGTSSAVNTVLSKLNELPSVMDKIPLAEHAAIYARTSTYDCTAAIQQAVTDYARCTIPAGLFLVSGTITMPTGHELIGGGMQATTFTRSGSALSFFVMGTNSSLRDVGFTRSGATTAVSGRLIDTDNASGCTLSGIFADHCWDGIYIKDVAGLFLERIYVSGWQNAGIRVDGGTNDVFLDHFILTGGTVGTGIVLHNKCEAFTASNGDVIGGSRPLTTTASGAFTPSLRLNPNFNKFANVYFDSSVLGVLLEKAAVTTFSNCWFATCVSSDGCNVGDCWDTVFDACEFVTNGGSGARLSNASQRGTKFNACKFLNNNGLNAGANGLTVDAGVSDWSVVDCTANGSLFAGALQGYGLFVSSGASNRYVVMGNNFTGNVVGGFSDGGTGTNKKILGNIGYVAPALAPTLTNSWVNSGAGTDDNAGYHLDGLGWVNLEGSIKNGTLTAVAFNLPAGYRPAKTKRFSVISNGAPAFLYVLSNGDVVPQTGSNVIFDLYGARFRPA